MNWANSPLGSTFGVLGLWALYYFWDLLLFISNPDDGNVIYIRRLLGRLYGEATFKLCFLNFVPRSTRPMCSRAMKGSFMRGQVGVFEEMNWSTVLITPEWGSLQLTALHLNNRSEALSNCNFVSNNLETWINKSVECSLGSARSQEG